MISDPPSVTDSSKDSAAQSATDSVTTTDSSAIGSMPPHPDEQNRQVRVRYAQLLNTAVFHPDPLAVESALATAADLGREWLRQGIPPEEVTDIHHEALMTLAREHPELTLGDVAQHLTAPLMEAYMAYSLAFREQLEQRAAALVNARLEQSRRLEAIGTLAAGIAHDFNNLLGSILGFTELLRDDFSPQSRELRYCENITLAGERARDLVRRMLTFARDLSDEPVQVDLNAAIRETLGLLKASLPVHLQVCYRSTVASASVLAAPSEIQQIVMNLCINAADAIGARMGNIDIALDWGLPPDTRGSAADPGHSTRANVAAAPSVGNPSLYLVLKVSDTGEGMSEETRQRVFDPFFTTKAPGKGSGLGLSVVHGIVGKLGGLLDVQSTPGQGTQFMIWLPSLDCDSGKAPGL